MPTRVDHRRRTASTSHYFELLTTFDVDCADVRRAGRLFWVSFPRERIEAEAFRLSVYTYGDKRFARFSLSLTAFVCGCAPESLFPIAPQRDAGLDAPPRAEVGRDGGTDDNASTDEDGGVSLPADGGVDPVDAGSTSQLEPCECDGAAFICDPPGDVHYAQQDVRTVYVDESNGSLALTFCLRRRRAPTRAAAFRTWGSTSSRARAT